MSRTTVGTGLPACASEEGGEEEGGRRRKGSGLCRLCTSTVCGRWAQSFPSPSFPRGHTRTY